MVASSVDVFIRSRRTKFGTDGQPCLKAHPSGWVDCNTFGRASERERIRVHVLPSEKSTKGALIVALQAWTGKYLQAYPSGEVHAQAKEIGRWEKFIVENHPPYIALKSKEFGTYVSCENAADCGKTLRANRYKAGAWGHWILVPHNQPDACTNPGYTDRATAAYIALVGGSVLYLASVSISALVLGLYAWVAAAEWSAAVTQSTLWESTAGGAFSLLQCIGATKAWALIPSCATAISGVGAVGAAANMLHKRLVEAGACEISNLMLLHHRQAAEGQ